MNTKAAKTVLTGLLFCLLAAGQAMAQEAAPSENQVKAAFLYNFAKFIKWPDDSFPATNSPITIGILGDSPFGTDLEVAVRSRTISGHPVVIKQVSMGDLKHCHVVFICRTPKRNLAETLEVVKGSGVLTVSELDRFTEAGGMIRFVMEGNKVRFEINDAAARAAGLSISSKLLNLAKKREGDR
jgi:YfiR/HmsC-like